MDIILQKAMAERANILEQFLKEKLINCKLTADQEGVQLCQNEDSSKYWIEYFNVKVSPILHFEDYFEEDGTYVLTSSLILSEGLRIQNNTITNFN